MSLGPCIRLRGRDLKPVCSAQVSLLAAFPNFVSCEDGVAEEPSFDARTFLAEAPPENRDFMRMLVLPPPHLCPCSHVQARRSAHLLNGAVPS